MVAAVAAATLCGTDSGSASPGFRFTDVTSQAGIQFQHNSGAFGGKFLPETLGSGCAFLDYDRDGWQDILLINGADWPGHKKSRTHASPLSQQRQRHLHRCNRARRPRCRDSTAWALPSATTTTTDSPTFSITCVGQNRLFRNTGKGTFVDVTNAAGLGKREGFSTSALWFDYDRDGLLDLFVCNYVKWSPEHDIFCSLDGKHKSYCTPEAYRGATCWLFHNRGDGTFEDVTAASGIFDSSSKSLGVALFDENHDGWPDLLVANDTQPNKLYRNQHNGTFKDAAVEAGLAFSSEGKARAGMGVDVADFDNSGTPGVAITNFDNEMIGLYRLSGKSFEDIAPQSGVGIASRNSLGFGCAFLDVNLDGWLDFAVANGHIDETVRNIRGNVGYAQPPQLFLNRRQRDLSRCRRRSRWKLRPAESRPRPCLRRLRSRRRSRPADHHQQRPGLPVSQRSACGKPQHPLSSGGNEVQPRRNRRHVRVFAGGLTQSRVVKGGSSYLSQSELPVTFGLEKRDRIERVVIDWPSGRTEEYKNLAAGRATSAPKEKESSRRMATEQN